MRGAGAHAAPKRGWSATHRVVWTALDRKRARMRQRTQESLQLSQEHDPMGSSAITSMMPRSIQVPSEIVRKWQEVVDVLAEIMRVPSASIMRVDPPHIKVFVSS